MKKLALLVFLFGVMPAFGQTVTDLPQMNVSSLPATAPLNTVVKVLDPISSSDCSVGGGNGVSFPPHECQWNGTTWALLGGVIACQQGTTAVPYFNGTFTLCDQSLSDDGAGTFGVVTLNASTAINTPQITFNGVAGFLIGPFQKQTAPASPATGQMVCWGDSGTNKYACKNSDGSDAMPTSGGGTLTVQTAGSSNSSQATLNFIASSAVNGLTITPTNPGGGGNETFTLSGTLTNTGLTNSATTVNGQTCTLGSSCTISGSAPTVVTGSSDTLTAAGTFATQTSITAGSTSFFEIRAHGVFSTTGTASPVMNMQVNAGGTTGICQHSGNNSLNINLTNLSWDVVCYVGILTTGNPGTASTWGTDTVATALTNGTFASRIFPQNAVSQNFITTTAQTVSIQETATLVAGTSITLQHLIVRAY